jgi:hypothetical protein
MIGFTVTIIMARERIGARAIVVASGHREQDD